MRYLTILLLTILILSPAVYAADSPSVWAADEVGSAISIGIVPDKLRSGYDLPITRAEFAELAVRFFSVVSDTPISELPAENIFKDTKNGYVAAAYGLGIINGVTETEFAPERHISREEAATILLNTYHACGKICEAFSGTTFSDSAYIKEWAIDGVSAMHALEIMKGVSETEFAPTQIYTREQSIVTFMRMYNKIVSSRNRITQMLSVKDGRLMAGDTEIVLSGVNLGGWLLIESWMSPIMDEDEKMAYSDILKILNERFGAKKAAALIAEYEKSFITDADFSRIADMGYNCVRLPFWYRSFMTEDGEWLADNHSQNPGFILLDRAVRLCEKYGLYLVPDMHGCPGGQSTNHSTGKIGEVKLYNNEENLAAMERLWTAIANRYKNKSVIAAYDIMNEPQNNGAEYRNSPPAESTAAIEQTNAVYDRMIKAIRQTGDTHIITVEGIWSPSALPDPEKYGWTNMMYQLHIYDTSKGMIDFRINELVNTRNTLGVAVYVGEYNSKENEAYAEKKYSENNISRTKWTYKTVGVNYDNWGLYNKQLKKADIKTADYDFLFRLFGAEMRTERGFE